MNLSTLSPKASPRKVAMAIPKMPARIPGTTKELHPLAVAIPHAVVGPPTLAFDAKSNSFRSKRNSFPNPRITSRWITIWTKANMKMLGAVLITSHMFPLAPTTVKNTCFEMKKVKIAMQHIILNKIRKLNLKMNGTLLKEHFRDSKVMQAN